MTEPTSDKQMRKYLAAFADGELEVQESLHVLEHMKMNPAATSRVMHHQRMRRLVDRAMREDAPPVPDALRRAIEQQARREAQSDRRAAQRGGVVARIGRWVPLGLAAAVLVGVFLLNHPQPPRNATPLTQGVSLVSATQARQFEQRHLDCSRYLDMLSDRTVFPSDLKAVPGALSEYFGKERFAPSLDLSAIGFRFDGLGRCSIPGSRAVHLVYHAIGDADQGQPEALSLWIAPYDGEPAIEENRLYRSDGKGVSHPIVIWRSGGMIHYLVGDRLDQVEKAATNLLASRS